MEGAEARLSTHRSVQGSSWRWALWLSICLACACGAAGGNPFDGVCVGQAKRPGPSCLDDPEEWPFAGSDDDVVPPLLDDGTDGDSCGGENADYDTHAGPPDDLWAEAMMVSAPPCVATGAIVHPADAALPCAALRG